MFAVRLILVLDDNVPPYHLRRMARIVDELSKNPHAVNVSEIPGQGHWFNGVVDDPILQVYAFPIVTSFSTSCDPLPSSIFSTSLPTSDFSFGSSHYSNYSAS